MTPGMLGLTALRARWGEDCGESPEPPQSLQLSSDADLLRCLRSDEHFDSRFSRERSTGLVMSRNCFQKGRWLGGQVGGGATTQTDRENNRVIYC